MVVFSTHEKLAGFFALHIKAIILRGPTILKIPVVCLLPVLVFRRKFSNLVRILPIRAPIVFVDLAAVVSVFNAIWEQFILLIIKFTSVDAQADR